VLNAVHIGRPHQRPERLAGDKGYSFDRIRAWLRRRKIGAVIPERSDQVERRGSPQPDFDKKAYRRRNVIERLIGWLKEYRRIGTRFEKLAGSFLGMIKLAMISRCFRIQLADRA
jgi:transposase